MTVITPGIDFLLRGAFVVIAPSVLFAIFLNYIFHLIDIQVSTVVIVLLGALALPVYAAFKICASDWKDRRQADRLGARLPPRVKGRSLGNLDVLRILIKDLGTGYIGDGIAQLMKEYGPIVDTYVLWDRFLYTTWPEHIKAILAKDFTNFEKGTEWDFNVHSVLGSGIFNSDGDRWKFHRSMTRPFFSRDRISHFDLFDRRAEIVIQKMRERSRQGLAIDFQDLMGRFTLDSATEFLFGSCVHSLNGRLPYPYNKQVLHYSNSQPSEEAADKFSDAFLQAQLIIAGRERMGWTWPLTEIWGDRTNEHMKVIDAFIAPIIKDAVQKKGLADKQKGLTGAATDVEKKDDIGDDETLLDSLVKFTSDPVVLKDEVLNIMIAGRDTTAATLTIILYFLSTHPEVFVRLRNEVIEKVGANKRPTFDDIRDMKYLRAVINETMRLYPIVPVNVRTSIEPTVWPSPDPNEKPIYIPAKTKVRYSVMLMQRRKDLWGPDGMQHSYSHVEISLRRSHSFALHPGFYLDAMSEEFDPDRFLDDRLKKYLISNSFAFLPFNAGPRICLGQQFAYNEMSFMIIRLLQAFDSFTLDEDAQPPETKPLPEWKNEVGTRKGMEKFFPKLGLTLYAHGGLWIKAKEAQE
ncbi:cytochrome P450 [Pleurotus eryngii]|uniref:Cytochrome P450 n=2 Tax=Pleurotus eryngii TaxID=5323 RepID=A0A9P5ZQT4_PLEER|nr:cytochrome P450 [Pleurotus eryngii]